MSGPPRVRSLNVTVGDPEARPVLVPAGNKARSVDGRKPVKKSSSETEKKPAVVAHSSPQCVSVPPPVISKRQDRYNHQAVLKSLSMNASCSSDASSTDSSTHSSGASSSGKVVARRRVRKKPERVGTDVVALAAAAAVEGDSSDNLEGKKRCGWVTPNNTGIFIPSSSLLD